jgi:hypothetical protein
MTKRQGIQRGQRVGLTVLLAMLIIAGSLVILQLNAQARVKGGGPGCGGTLATLLAEVDDGDTILNLTGSAWESDGALITKNILLQGGWELITPPCTSTDTTNFQFVWPTERSILSHFGSPVAQIDPSVISLTLQYLDIESSGGTIAQGAGISGTISGTITSTARVLLENLVITNNTATNGGGGLYLEVRGGASLIISGTQIAGNNAGTGGGFEIHVFDNSQVIIQNSQISTNTADSGNGGGGRILIHSGSVSLVNTAIFNNQAAAGFGGGLSVEGTGSGPAYLILQNTVITGNNANIDDNLHHNNVIVLDKQSFLPIIRKNS